MGFWKNYLEDRPRLSPYEDAYACDYCSIFFLHKLLEKCDKCSDLFCAKCVPNPVKKDCKEFITFVHYFCSQDCCETVEDCDLTCSILF